MQASTGQIPETLLYEELGGRKYYRRGYRQALFIAQVGDPTLGVGTPSHAFLFTNEYDEIGAY